MSYKQSLSADIYFNLLQYIGAYWNIYIYISEYIEIYFERYWNILDLFYN